MNHLKPETIKRYDEIERMLFGFGDTHKPNQDTVHLIESITKNQLELIIQQATKYQEGKTLTGENLVFLMRKNKHKMRRFIKYLKHKDLKKQCHSSLTSESKPESKNKLIEFIEYIDETGELSDLTEYDEVKFERVLRADRISLSLDEENYLKFNKARCASFAPNRNFEHLRAWVDPKEEIKFSNCALEVLNYYAYETIAQITDYALLVRLDHNRTTDPLANLQGTHYSACMFNGEHRLGGSNPDYNKVYNGQAPITVSEVKEVMRRVYMPQSGKLNLGRRLPETHHILAL